MSRVVTSAVESAIEDNQTIRQTARLTVYKSRVFFDDTDLVDNAPGFAHPVAETGQFIPEAFSHCEAGFVTAVVDVDGTLWLMTTDSDVPIDTGVVADPRCRPGAFGNFIFYFTGPGGPSGAGEWRRMEIGLGASGLSVVSDDPFSDFVEPGAIYPTGENDAFLCYIKNGGVAVSLSIAGAAGIECPGRFINPAAVLDATLATDIYKTHFAGAAETNLGRFFYFSQYDGSVRCLKHSNGMFSDFEVSIPSDLSNVAVGNVFSHNNVVHMCCQFERKEEFESPAKYTLFTQSKDGITFGLDQRVLVTMEDYRFLAAFDGVDQLAFSATNRSYQTDAHYQVIQEAAPFLNTLLNSVEGSSSGWSAQLKSGEEEYYDESFIIDGAYARLEVGTQSSDGDVLILQPNGEQVPFKFIVYHDVVVAEFSKLWVDGERGMNLQIVPDGLWHTSVMSHPFYLEIQGKQGIYDPAKELNNLYKFSDDNGIKWSLTSDLWTDASTPFAVATHPAATTSDHWSPDLLSFLEEYPVFGDQSTYEMKLYGWSRAGVPDTNPNSADATPTSTDNDDFYGLVEVEDSNGNVSTVVTTSGQLSSSHKNPLQTWFEAGARAGSSPVSYNLANPGEGKKIKRIGIRVISIDGNTTYYLERVEMAGIAAQYTAESVADEQPFQVVDVSSNWPLVDTLTLQVTTGNAADGDQVEMVYQPKAGRLYAIAVVGEVMFDRGSRYLQDAHFVASAGLSDPDPTWDRSYPPGTGPQPNAAVEITFDEWPYYTPAVMEEMDVVKGTVPDPSHAYLLHWADPRMSDSVISAEYIPYFYSDGNGKHKVALYLAGSGAISNIVGGEFKVYVFESPETIESFDYYGGETGGSGGAPFRIVDSSPDLVGQWTAGVDYFNLTLSRGSPPGNGSYVTVRNNTGADAGYRVTMARTGKWIYEFPFTGTAPSILRWNWGALDNVNQTQDTFYDTPYNQTGSNIVNIPAATNRQQAIHNGGGQDHNHADIWTGLGFGQETVSFTIQTVGEPTSNQVPSPSGGADFNISIPLLGTFVTLSGGIGPHIATSKKGVPQIAFSTRPYSAYNFEVTGRFKLKGPYSQGGLIGLASDQKNFMLGYIKPGYAGIARVRNGVRENIFEDTLDEVEENKLMEVRFWHRDGIFGLEVKRAQEFWPRRGSQFLYTWDGDDGAIAVVDDIFHVGVYAIIDPPKVRITGFRSTSRNLAVMPLDWNPDTAASGLSAFSSHGQIDVGGKIYTYTGKNTSVANPRGPFHLRNAGEWAAEYNRDRLGYTYPNTYTLEATFFNWLPGSTNALDYAGKLIAVSEGYAWPVEKTLWRVWITTDGQLVWLRNRSRWYSTQQPSFYAMGYEKVWLTNGLTGVTPAVNDDLDYLHPPGAFAFLHHDDAVSLHGFTGFSGERDNSIADLLDRFCKISGTLADMPGDFLLASAELDDEEDVDLG